MSSRLKAFLQYTVIIAITVLLIWFSLQGIHVGRSENKWDYLLTTWERADKGWLLIMAGFAILSHITRAYRWNLLLKPTGNTPKLTNSFISLMTGYLVNLAIPRGGEISRCYNLYKLEKIPVDVSFGTVVVERIVDLLCLLLLIAIAFVLQYEKLLTFFGTLPLHLSEQSSNLLVLLYVIIAVLLLAAVTVWLIRKNTKLRTALLKSWQGIKNGLSSVFRLEHKGYFIFYSLLIWFLYFLMSYAVIKAFPATAHLGFNAVVSLFAIGSIAMAVPLPGGTGSYHVLVPQGLIFLYAIPSSEATAFTFIFHGWQTLIMIVGGAISLIVTSFIVKRKSVQ